MRTELRQTAVQRTSNGAGVLPPKQKHNGRYSARPSVVDNAPRGE